MDPSSGISEAITFDIQAVRMRDPACKSFFQCICFFKGFQAIQSYRVAHWLWVNGRTTLALALQSRISDAVRRDTNPPDTSPPLALTPPPTPQTTNVHRR